MKQLGTAITIMVVLAILASCGSGCAGEKGKESNDGDRTPPTISDVRVSPITQTSATITWITDEEASSCVEYGLTTRYTSNATSSDDMVMSHSVALTGLTADTTYHYRVKSSDSNGVEAASGDATFETLPSPSMTTSLIIDHRCTDIYAIPQEWIAKAKSDLHIAYGYTSHGSQIITGMSGLHDWKGSLYAFSTGGSDGALDLRGRPGAPGADEYMVNPFPGVEDLGNPNQDAWYSATRNYLSAHPEINVIMWSWCGQLSSRATDAAKYCNQMATLEEDYPDVDFVYMTGHTDGTGLSGTLHTHNNEIRDWVNQNPTRRILYDFEDIESYNPDGVYFGDKNVTDSCAYSGGNWAIEWQNSHTEGIDWYNLDPPPAHTQPLNGNMKAYAAWWLWARLAGWDGTTL